MSELEVGLLRGRITQTLLGALWLVSLVALAVALAVATTPALIAALPLALIVGIFLTIRRATAARPVVERGRLRLRGDAVMLGARRLAERSRITSGAVVPSAPEGVVVRLERRGWVSLELQAPDVDRAREALVELGLDPRHAVARFSVLASDPATFKRRMRMMIPMLVVFGATVAIAGALRMPLAIPLLVVLMVVTSLSLVVPSEVTVGSDGISIRRWGREEFVSLDGVVDAHAAEGDTLFNSTLAVVQLLDESGAVVRELLVDQKKDGPFTEGIHRAIDARAEALAERVREVIEVRRARDGAFDPRALARNGRAVGVWLASLRSLLVRTTGFRDEEPPTPDALLAIVEDGSAAAIDRAAAAIALSRADDSIKQRVRIAADATAAPRLRVALEAAVDDDDEQKLASALEEIERAREA